MTTRALTLALIRRHGEMTAAELAPEIEVSKAGAYHHLRRLEKSGAIRRHYYPRTPQGDRLVFSAETVADIRRRIGVPPAADAQIIHGLRRAGRGGHVEIRWAAL